MQKKTILIFILLAVGLLAWYFLRPNRNGSSDKSKTAFAIANTDEIDKIFISHKTEGKVLLEKKKGIWFVNGKYEAFKPTIDFFLNETIKKIRVKGPVPKPARDLVIASMATMAFKTEIYINGELEKTYYVGQPTTDMMGTYMYLEGSDEPYITNIPGFDGFLSSRYPVDEKEWVTKVIFDYKPEQIKSVDVNYPEDINSGFTVTRKNNKGDFDISAAKTAPNGTMNYAAVKSYFGMFGFKCAEAFVEFTPHQLDSMKKSVPFCIITLIDSNAITRKLTVYKRASSDRDHSLHDNKGNRLAYDPSRFNALLDNDNRVMIIQDLVFDPIMINFSDFFLKTKRD